LRPPAWNPEHPLARLIAGRVRDFDFFQLLNLLERSLAGAAPIGRQGPVKREAVRLRPELSLGFPCADFSTADWREEPDATQRLRLTVTFLGLYGADSPLATHFTERLLISKDNADDYEKDDRVREFLDLFHHRLLSLLYRVWIKYRHYATFQPDGRDPISLVIRGFMGIGTDHLDDKLGVPAVRLFRYAGILLQRPRSATGLAGQLRDYFPGVPFDIESCVGRWLRIDPADQNRLGRGGCTLGQDFLVGQRMFDRSGKFRVKVGPLGFEAFSRFLPGGSAAAEIAQVVRFYCTDPLDFDLHVTLRGEEVPDLPLAGTGVLGRLSQTTWLKSQPSPDKSVIFRAEA
jgi:type VI secretion system protein ImpH